MSNFNTPENTFQLFSCSITSNQKPIKFIWTRAVGRDQKLLNSDGNVQIESSDNFSFLSLKNVHRNDSGNYTCAVSNRHGQDSVTFHLSVKGTICAPDMCNLLLFSLYCRLRRHVPLSANLVKL